MLVWWSLAAARASALETAYLLGIGQRHGREHLQRDATAQRLLLGFVDDSHAAPSDLAKDAIVPQPLQHGGSWGDAIVAGQRFARAARALAQVLHHQKCREELANLVGQVGVAVKVFA
jgi:hypothetical protein